jgi:aminopeptidase
VVIQGTLLAEPLMTECFRSVLAAGGNPTTVFNSPRVREILLREGSDSQLLFLPPTITLQFERMDAYIAITAPANTQALTSVNPQRMVLEQQASGRILETYMQRSANGDLVWTGTAFPTEAAAQDAVMSLTEYENFLFNAALLSEPDPVAAWKAMGERQQRLVDWLTPRSEVHVTATGTDLRLNVGGRTWVNDDGHKNFPGGEVFTGPIEDSAEGVVSFTYPGFYAGKEVSGVRLKFERGVVVEATAETNESFLHDMLDLDDGAKRIGEFAFGTNAGITRFTRSVLFDEKIGGTLHMALGASIPETAGTNKSALHWDMVTDLRGGGEVTVDGAFFSKNGEFQI